MKMRGIHIKLLLLFFLAAPVLLSAQGIVIPKKCTECHNKTNAKKFVHPASKESCKNCHIPNGKPHPSENDEEGFKLAEKMPDLCFTCHDPVNTMKLLHPPVKQKDCLACHEVHSSDQKDLVFAAQPDLCYFCHGDIEKRMDSVKTTHLMVGKGIVCTTCHSPHQSKFDKLLFANKADACLTCHNKPIQSNNGPIADISKELAGNKYVHGAITKNGCTGCHDPHASKQQKLLTGAFDNSIYVNMRSKDYNSLCFNCHDMALLKKQNVAKETGFNNEGVNLHFKHSNQAKGRNCVSCHGIHSAPNAFLLVDKLQFGDWQMPLKYTPKPNGGSCITACHEVKTYSRAQ